MDEIYTNALYKTFLKCLEEYSIVVKDTGDIKYIRQALEFRAEVYKQNPRHKEYLKDIEKILKKFRAMEQKHEKKLKERGTR